MIFADVGWAGPRDEFTQPQRRLSGAGAGFAALDGLFRLDVSRALEGARAWRVDFYIEVR